MRNEFHGPRAGPRAGRILDLCLKSPVALVIWGVCTLALVADPPRHRVPCNGRKHARRCMEGSLSEFVAVPLVMLLGLATVAPYSGNAMGCGRHERMALLSSTQAR